MTVDAAAASETTPIGVRVLVVVDDVVICSQMAANLSSAGYQVVTAHDGARALAQAEETPPDLAMVSTSSGKLKGRLGPAVHIVVMTGHDDEVSHAEAFEADTDDFVVKPAGMTLAGPRCHDRDRLQDRPHGAVRPALVERVLHNLVGNAARYCNQGGSIVVGARRWNDDDSIEISVTNSGPPIANDIRSQLFVKYVRGKGGQSAGWACILPAGGRSPWRKDRSEADRDRSPLRRPTPRARVTQLPRYASGDLRPTARPHGEG